MADQTLILIFTYIIPPLVAFAGIILMASGVMDNKHYRTVLGVMAFFGAALLPLLILPSILSS